MLRLNFIFCVLFRLSTTAAVRYEARDRRGKMMVMGSATFDTSEGTPAIWLGTNQQQTLSQTAVDMAKMKLDLKDAYDSFVFEKMVVDQKCNDAPPIRMGKAEKGMGECKTWCIEQQCRFMMFYTGQITKYKRRCEIYNSCKTMIPMETSAKAFIYRVITPCVHAYPTYVATMAASFPKGIVRSDMPDPNLHCTCTAPAYMICAIFTNEGSLEEKIVKQKFEDPEDEKRIKPFTFLLGHLRPNHPAYVYSGVLPLGATMSTVHAELLLLNYDRCLLIDQCTFGTPGGKCPVAHRKFISGDPVYIRRIDRQRTKDGKPVPCITISGFRQEWKHYEDNTDSFPDPFYGGEHEPPQISEADFDIYYVYSNERLTHGMCRPRSALTESVLHDLADTDSRSESPKIPVDKASHGSSKRKGKGRARGKKPTSLPQQEKRSVVVFSNSPDSQSEEKRKEGDTISSMGSYQSPPPSEPEEEKVENTQHLVRWSHFVLFLCIILIFSLFLCCGFMRLFFNKPAVFEYKDSHLEHIYVEFPQ